METQNVRTLIEVTIISDILLENKIKDELLEEWNNVAKRARSYAEKKGIDNKNRLDVHSKINFRSYMPACMLLKINKSDFAENRFKSGFGSYYFNKLFL